MQGKWSCCASLDGWSFWKAGGGDGDFSGLKALYMCWGRFSETGSVAHPATKSSASAWRCHVSLQYMLLDCKLGIFFWDMICISVKVSVDITVILHQPATISFCDLFPVLQNVSWWAVCIYKHKHIWIGKFCMLTWLLWSRCLGAYLSIGFLGTHLLSLI